MRLRQPLSAPSRDRRWQLPLLLRGPGCTPPMSVSFNQSAKESGQGAPRHRRPDHARVGQAKATVLGTSLRWLQGQQTVNKATALATIRSSRSANCQAVKEVPLATALGTPFTWLLGQQTIHMATVSAFHSDIQVQQTLP